MCLDCIGFAVTANSKRGTEEDTGSEETEDEDTHSRSREEEDTGSQETEDKGSEETENEGIQSDGTRTGQGPCGSIRMVALLETDLSHSIFAENLQSRF